MMNLKSMLREAKEAHYPKGRPKEINQRSSFHGAARGALRSVGDHVPSYDTGGDALGTVVGHVGKDWCHTPWPSGLFTLL